MPFMIGPSPIRRTTKYLEAGRIIFRETVRIFSINFNLNGDHHEGAREFVHWHLPQIQYKNPKVQCVTFTDITPTPFIKIYFEDTKSVLIDIDSRGNSEILDHLQNFTAVCKKPEEILSGGEEEKNKIQTCYFGTGCRRHCICEVTSQVPCPSVISLPNSWRARGKPLRKEKYRIPLAYMCPELKEDEDEED